MTTPARMTTGASAKLAGAGGVRAMPVSVIDAIVQVEGEFQRRRDAFDVAAAAYEQAGADLEEMLDQLATLVMLLGSDRAPSLDDRRGPKGKPITWKGRTLSIWQWSKVTGIRANTIYLRLKRGWAVERALTEAEHEKAQPAHDVKADEQSDDTPEVSPPPAQLPPPVSDVVAPVVPPAEPALAPAPKVTDWRDVVATSKGQPEPAGDSGPGDDDDQDDKRAASIEELNREVDRQQQGQKSKTVVLATTTTRGKGSNGHGHQVRVDRFGDGNTVADSSGHVHRVTRFLVGRAHGHAHDLVVP